LEVLEKVIRRGGVEFIDKNGGGRAFGSSKPVSRTR